MKNYISLKRIFKRNKNHLKTLEYGSEENSKTLHKKHSKTSITRQRDVIAWAAAECELDARVEGVSDEHFVGEARIDCNDRWQSDPHFVDAPWRHLHSEHVACGHLHCAQLWLVRMLHCQLSLHWLETWWAQNQNISNVHSIVHFWNDKGTKFLVPLLPFGPLKRKLFSTAIIFNSYTSKQERKWTRNPLSFFCEAGIFWIFR